jgi:outer membrane protein assembly factor BamC
MTLLGNRLLCGLSIGATLLLSGCAVSDYIEEKGKIDYKSASTNRRPSLEVPPDLISPRADERFSLPARQGERTLSSFERERASGAAAASAAPGVLPNVPGMRIERAGLQRWIVVEAPPEKIWTRVREFWTETGFALEVDNPEAGILETNWLENRARIPMDFIRKTIGRVLDGAYSSGTIDKFRIRIERTPEGRSEIYVSHRGMEEIATVTRDRTTWQRRQPEPDLEVEMMNRLMIHLAGGQPGDRQAAAATAGGSQAAAPADVRVVGEGPERSLEIADPFDRAWRRVGLALDRGGFTVEDRDRSRGAYFVRYIDSDEQARAAASERPGFLSRLFTRASKPELSQQYRLVLAGAGDGVRLTVQDKDGKPTLEADRGTVNRILDLIMQQMLQ